jgi:thioredoxin 1
MAASNIVTLTAKNFSEEVLKSPTPVLVDFWAEWCGPCKMIAPVLDELADEFEGRVKIGKLDIDHEQSIAAEYRVSGIPTFLVFKDGQVVSQQVGIAGGKPKLKTLIETAT